MQKKEPPELKKQQKRFMYSSTLRGCHAPVEVKVFVSTLPRAVRNDTKGYHRYTRAPTFYSSHGLPCGLPPV